MKLSKNNQLIFASLILAMVFCATGAVAQAQTSQADVNRNQADINENQAKVNKNQSAVNAAQAKVNKEHAGSNQTQSATDQLSGDSHRSAVATYVQGLLNVADNAKGGIGDQVKVIAQAQNNSKDAVASEIDAIKNRGGFKTFFIGTDYKNVGMLRSDTVKTRNQIDQLTKLLDKTTNEADKTTLQTQIQSLTAEQQKINDFLKTNESKFSLFGWFVKLFY